MYRIIGADQKEYGPVGLDELRRWMAEGRLHANSPVQFEGATEWKPLASFPELMGLLPANRPVPLTPQSTLPVQQSNSMAVAGLVLSCVAMLCCSCGPLGVLGIVFSAIGVAQANRDPAQSGKGIAIAGIVIGSLTVLGSIVTVLMGWFGAIIDQIMNR